MDYYLPQGRWTNLLSGEVVTGGRWVHEVHDFMSLPLMVRENTILPVGALDSTVEYDYSKSLTLYVFELNDETQCEVVDMNGEKFLTVTAKNVAGKVSFHFVRE